MKRFIITTLFMVVGVVALLGYGVFRYKHRPPKPSPIIKAAEMNLRIIEGWDSQDIAEYLEKSEFVKQTEFLTAIKNFDSSQYPLLASKPAKMNLEGFLYPDTYRVFDPRATNTLASTKTPSEQLIEKMLGNFSDKFTPEMQAAAKKSGLSIYELIVLASIVEKETGRNAVSTEQKAALAAERKIIAGIFYNRLNISMALESDATVNFVTHKNDPAASLEDIKIDSPYNTYKYRGLPPGPIGNPSLSSIMAVLYPTETDYMYFLHKQPSGEAVYSKTHDEHVANKFKYLK